MHVWLSSLTYGKPFFSQTEMSRQFDHEAEDFTLEKIIEFGFDQFAEQIGDISGAATKELAIEQVCKTEWWYFTQKVLSFIY